MSKFLELYFQNDDFASHLQEFLWHPVRYILYLQAIKKLTPKFKLSGFDGDFDEWNRNRQLDGFLCRTDADCAWVDSKLKCDKEGFRWFTMDTLEELKCYDTII